MSNVTSDAILRITIRSANRNFVGTNSVCLDINDDNIFDVCAIDLGFDFNLTFEEPVNLTANQPITFNFEASGVGTLLAAGTSSSCSLVVDSDIFFNTSTINEFIPQPNTALNIFTYSRDLGNDVIFEFTINQALISDSWIIIGTGLLQTPMDFGSNGLMFIDPAAPATLVNAGPSRTVTIPIPPVTPGAFFYVQGVTIQNNSPVFHNVLIITR